MLILFLSHFEIKSSLCVHFHVLITFLLTQVILHGRAGVFAYKLFGRVAGVVHELIAARAIFEAQPGVAPVLDHDADVAVGGAVGPAEGGARAREVVVALDPRNANESHPGGVRNCR